MPRRGFRACCAQAMLWAHAATATTAADGGGAEMTASPSSLPAGSPVLLTPSDDVQKAIDGNPAGTTFVLAPGVYRNQGVWETDPSTGERQWVGLQINKNYTTLVAQQRRTAVFSGAVPLPASAVRAAGGGVWAVNISGLTDNTTWPKPGTGYGVCEKGFEACNYRQDLFVNDSALRRYPSADNLTAPGAALGWFLDYARSEAVCNFDPTAAAAAGALEISFAHVFMSAGEDVVVFVRGLVIEKVATHAQTNTCEGAYEVDDCEIRWAHGGGVGGHYVTNNHIHHIGQLGGSALRLLENNTVEYCNYANYSYSWEAGGFKVFSNKATHDKYGPLVIRNNTARFNFGPGLWSDGGGWNITYDGNTLTDNALAGIHHEISFHATIVGNTVHGNCWRYAPWHAGGPSPWGGYCGQVTLSTSQGVTVERNTIEVDPAGAGNYAAVALYQDPRGVDRATGRTYKCRDNRVVNNTIVYKSKGGGHVRTGVVGFDNATQWPLANITFDGNDYTLPAGPLSSPPAGPSPDGGAAVEGADGAATAWWWCDGPGVPPSGRAPCRGFTFAEFRAAGQERSGRVHPPGGAT